MKKLLVLIVIIVWVGGGSAWGATINIPGDQPTIQSGINAAITGDIVLLADGIYAGVGNYNIEFNGKSITIKSVNGPTACIIDCQQLGRGFLIYNDEAVTLEGLTIKNGVTEGNGHGGGVYSDGSVIFINCIFDGNLTSHDDDGSKGGAVYVSFSSASSEFIDCTFTNNNAAYGGAVYPYSSSTFTGCTFENNSAINYGGATSSFSSSSFTNCTFKSNSAAYGGAVNGGSSSPSIFTDCSFANNDARGYGGAIHSSASIVNCEFAGNTISDGGGGGAVYCSFSSTITNCIFTDNNGDHFGGAIYCDPSGSSTAITNCSFTLNNASSQGGAIWCDIPSGAENPVSLKNCILWDNKAPDGPEIYERGKPLIITYSNIKSGHIGEGNIDSDPLFVDSNNNDLHIQYNSPCRDTGTVNSGVIDDFDGNPRPIGSGYDMGAYEHQGSIIIDSFSASPTTGNPLLTVEFTCLAHDDYNTITGYQWNFGDGNIDTTLTGTNQHIYSIPGTFTASCTVINDSAEQMTSTSTIKINYGPYADAGRDQIIPGNSVQLDGSGSYDPDGTINSWEWTLNHTENSAYDRGATGKIVNLSGLEFGHYTVTLIVTNNLGVHGIDNMFLSVAARQSADLDNDGDIDGNDLTIFTNAYGRIFE